MTLLVRAGSCACALPLSSVQETMRALPTHPLAGLPAFVRGVSIIRGAPTPVLDVAALLGLAGDAAPRRFVTLRVGDRPVALGVEEVLGVRALDAGIVDRSPPLLRNAGAEVVEAMGALDAELLVVLRTARLIPDEVWSALAAREAES